MKAFLGGTIIGGAAVGAAAYFAMEAEQSRHETIRSDLEARLAEAREPITEVVIPDPTVSMASLGDRPLSEAKKQYDDYIEEEDFYHERPAFTVLSARTLFEIDEDTVEHVCIFRERRDPYHAIGYTDIAIYMKDGYKPAQRHEKAGTFTQSGPTYGFVIQGRDPGIIWQSGWFTDPATAKGQEEPFPAAPADIYITLTGADDWQNVLRLQSLVPSREIGMCEGADMKTDYMLTDQMK